MSKKVIEHPNTRLIKIIEKQQKEIRDLQVDVLVLKDLLVRTVRMLARAENQGLLPLPFDKKK